MGILAEAVDNYGVIHRALRIFMHKREFLYISWITLENYALYPQFVDNLWITYPLIHNLSTIYPQKRKGCG